jgi:hypothetical protein
MEIKKTKAKRIAIMFFVVGAWGVGVNVMFGNPFILFLSAINLVLRKSIHTIL